MAQATAIQWTETTWNPVTGCNKISPGCKNCYAERMAHRLQKMRNPRYENGFKVTQHPDLIEAPKSWRKPKLIFVNSMSDVFHPEVEDDFIQRIFDTIVETPRHTYQLLTKRPERALDMTTKLPWPNNLWMGASVENANYVHRIDTLRQIPAAIRFLSCEPLLGPLANLNLQSIHWLIAGGESGPKAHDLTQHPDWVRNIRDQCVHAEIPFFFKQWGGYHPKARGNLLDGKIWMQMPTLHHSDNNITAQLENAEKTRRHHMPKQKKQRRKGKQQIPNRDADTLCPQCGEPAETRATKNKLTQSQTHYFREYIKCTVCHKQTNVIPSKRLVLEDRNATNCDDPDNPRCGCTRCESRNQF